MPARSLVTTLVAVVLASTLGGCSDDSDPARPPVAEPTPIDSFVGATAEVARAEFCSRIPDDAVADAVGAVASTGHYSSGERAQVTGTVEDVSHEFSCTFTGTGGDVVRAWVFAPPVTPTTAAALVDGVRRTKGCRLVPGHAFGSPATGSVCATPGGAQAAYRGLFGDAWLSCSLTDGGTAKLPQPALLAAAGAWCVRVAGAASS